MQTPHQATVVPITDPKAIDLSRHALIEASAGTGKTYTIENLVVRLLMEENGIGIEQILLVTFTEKATSELKQRIREKIATTLDEGVALCEAVAEKLNAALEAFDNAAIFTIHGFCHSLLREFPFEAGTLFEQELIDDGPLFEKLLREQIRGDWPKRYGRRLKDLLRLSPFADNPDRFVTEVAALARRLRGDPDHETLIPDPEGLDVEALWREAEETVRVLKDLLGAPPAFSDAYGRLNIHASTKNRILRDLILPIESVFGQVGEPAMDLLPVFDFVRDRRRMMKNGVPPFDDLIPQKWLKAGENLDVCPSLGEIKAHLDALDKIVKTLSHALTLGALPKLQGDVRALKTKNGWIAYQDMLSLVAGFLNAPASAAGLEKIRQRYRVAFVDEFQDTDDMQWRIFKTIFMPPDGGNRLFLIGDPKQAIYGFRGADVFTYLDARKRLFDLTAQDKAHLYRLDTNWRSLPSMIQGFNKVFGQDDWFGSEADKGAYEIGYPPSESPAMEELPLTVGSDGSGRQPFNIVDLSQAQNHDKAKKLLATFIAHEIRFLVDRGGISLRSKSGDRRPLTFGDIAILVRSQKEFLLLEKQFQGLAIPHAYYRQPGLFQCPQAHWLAMVLKAVVRPQDTPEVRMALLTPFFDMAPQGLEAWPELPADHPSQALFLKWHEDALNKRWGRLFQSLMEESGLTARHCTDAGWQRVQTNFRQLFDYLETTAYAQNMDMGAMVAHLDNLRLLESASGTDADIHEIEGEGDKVQVLTMHVSKGLEFPVVFVAGGLTVRAMGGIRSYHAADPDDPSRPPRKIVDLTGDTGQEAAAREFEDENKRLYYVALTRARMKVYVPFYPDNSNRGWIGPLCRFVSQSVEKAFKADHDGIREMAWLDTSPVERLPSSQTPDAEHGEQAATATPLENLLPVQTDFRHRRIALESFSSIGHRLLHQQGGESRAQVFRLIDEARRDDDEPAAGLDLDPMGDATFADLPGGANMGSMFHHIFENIDFRKVVDGPANLLGDDGMSRVIESAALRYGIDSQWLPAIGGLSPRP